MHVGSGALFWYVSFAHAALTRVFEHSNPLATVNHHLHTTAKEDWLLDMTGGPVGISTDLDDFLIWPGAARASRGEGWKEVATKAIGFMWPALACIALA